jgi:hypothetical protein
VSAESIADISAAMDGYRSSGLFAIARLTISSTSGGTFGLRVRTLGTGSRMCFIATAMKPSPV